jgi:hypothetical protein
MNGPNILPWITDLLEYAFFHQLLTENDSISSDIKEGKYLINTPPKRVNSGKNKKGHAFE